MHSHSRSDPPAGPFAAAVRALAAEGCEARFSQSASGEGTRPLKVSIPRKSLQPSARALAGVGFACIGLTWRRARFLGFDPESERWGELVLELRARPWAPGRFLASQARMRWRARVSPAVAVMGPDGAGKSSLIERLSGSFPLPVRTVYMGLYQGADGSERRPAVPGVALAGNVARQWTRWMRGLVHRVAGRLVLFDRYTYDSLLSSDASPSRLRRLRRSLMARVCPPPDLLVVLDAPADVLFDRKREHDPRFLEAQRQRLLRVAETVPRARVIDATLGAELVERQVMAAIWELYCSRTGRPPAARC